MPEMYNALSFPELELIDEIFEKYPSMVIQARENERLSGWLVGKVMLTSKGKANPQVVHDLIIKKLTQMKEILS